jgi:hypothetical protein
MYNGYWVVPRGKGRPGNDAGPSPPSSAVVKKGQSYTSTPPMGHTACTEPQCLYKGALTMEQMIWWLVIPRSYQESLNQNYEIYSSISSPTLLLMYEAAKQVDKQLSGTSQPWAPQRINLLSHLHPVRSDEFYPIMLHLHSAEDFLT